MLGESMSKLTQASKGSTCINCGNDNAYSCHYNGPRQMDYGKGRGIKADDLATAELCHSCDQIFTEGSTVPACENKWERSEMFLHLIMLTNIRRFKEGTIKT